MPGSLFFILENHKNVLKKDKGYDIMKKNKSREMSMDEVQNIEAFKEEKPTLASYWRSIILFGKNVASYKFALGKSLLEILPSSKTEITLQELAVPFSRNICEHLKIAPKQATSGSSRFLDACKKYNEEAIGEDELIEETIRNGFNCVLDAFHNVNNGIIPVRFYDKKFSAKSKSLILTDEIYRLQESPYHDNFSLETESRWRLVETAWELNISRNLLNIKFDEGQEILFVDNNLRRKSVTSARDALNGYQKGKCFYCGKDIDLNNSIIGCDVDHFFPHMLQTKISKINFNGIWNLVLACPNCNRGEKGKFAKVPNITYLEKLFERNEYLIASHHPLRETLINQTGKTTDVRRAFLKEIDREAINLLINRWP